MMRALLIRLFRSRRLWLFFFLWMAASSWWAARFDFVQDLDAPARAAALQGTATATSVPGWPATEDPSATSPPPRRPGVVYLPTLNFLGQDDVCETWLSVQNLGCDALRAVALFWGEPGFCPPQAAGAMTAVCSGLIGPGKQWTMLGAQIARGSKSAMVFPLTTLSMSDFTLDHSIEAWTVSPFADLLCETLYFGGAYFPESFYRAYLEGLDYEGYPLDLAAGQGRIAVEALRSCPGGTRAGSRITSRYRGVVIEEVGGFDPEAGGYVYHAPDARSGEAHDSMIHVQNVGYACATVEVWLHAERGGGSCATPILCDIFDLAMGEALMISAAACAEGEFVGSYRIVSSEPLAGTVDHLGAGSLATTPIQSGPQGFDPDGDWAWLARDAEAAETTIVRAPMVYKGQAGRSSTLHLVNQDSDGWADLRIRFIDPSGATRLLLRDWLCPNGSRHYPLSSLVDLPAGWSGSVRVEARDASPGKGVSEGPRGEQGARGYGAPYLAGSVSHASDLDPDQPIAAYPMFRERVPVQGAGRVADETGATRIGLADGLGVVAVPSLGQIERPGADVLATELVLQVSGSAVSWTDVGTYIYDGNGLVDHVCHRLYPEQLWRLDSGSLSFLGPDFRGSAVISASRWQEEAGASRRELERVGLLAVALSGLDTLESLGAGGASQELADGSGTSIGLWIHDPRLLEESRFCEPHLFFGPPCP